MQSPLLQFTKVRETLLARQRQLLTRAQNVESDRRRERDPLSADAPDRAIQRENDEVLDRIGEAAEDELSSITMALRRLDEGSYGICQVCCGEIDTHRLAAIPYTALCQSCAAQANS